jgi:Golgi phosphoprotein 3 (GPP34)
MLIAEEFLLLCLDDLTGRAVGADKIVPALGGALLVELALLERISISPDEEGLWKRRRVTITSTKPTDDPVLDDAISYIAADEGKKLQELITPLAWHPMTKGVYASLLRRLAAAGVLTEQHGHILGIFPTTSWPTVDATAETELRARLRSALVDGLTPTERTVALIGLLHATGHILRAVPDAEQKLVKRRAKELAEGDWAARAVAEVIASMSTAVGLAAAT